jgi:sporulation protein YlmC with PRC-barrel domain
MRRPSRIAFTAALTLALGSAAAAAPARAAETRIEPGNGEPIWVDVTTWDTERLYRGWSAQRLLGGDVLNARGEKIGEVEDFLVGPKGQIAKVIVEAGGLLDIGDQHVAVPWEQVTRDGASSISVPVTRDNLDDYGMFATVDEMRARPDTFRLRELLGDPVTASGVGYGVVRDVVFDAGGKIEGVIAKPVRGRGYEEEARPVPFWDTYDPYQPYYDVPYGIQDLQALEPFDYGRFD